VPERIEGLGSKRIVSVACGELHSLALSKNGEVFAWGSASMGRLGIGRDELLLPTAETSQPMLVTRLLGSHIVQVVCSKVNSGALSSQGDVYTWGATCYGLASCPSNSSAQTEPAMLPTPQGPRISVIAMGKLHALALTVHDAQIRYASTLRRPH